MGEGIIMISNNNIMELEIRRNIFNYILNNPGLHQRELSRIMKLPKSTLIHHLKVLTKQELITTSNLDGYQRIFINKEISTKEKEILHLIRQKLPQQILLYFIFRTACSQIELSEELEKKPSTISYHIKKLKEMDIIEEVPIKDGIIIRWNNPKYFYERKLRKGEKIYRIKSIETQIDIFNMFIVYKNSLYHKNLIDSVLTIIDHFLESPKVIKTDVVFEMIFKYFFDVFPHPYHA